MRMNYWKSIAAFIALVICVSSWAASQSTPHDLPDAPYSRMKVVELERNGREFSYLAFDFEARTVSLVQVSYGNLSVTTRKMN